MVRNTRFIKLEKIVFVDEHLLTIRRNETIININVNSNKSVGELNELIEKLDKALLEYLKIDEEHFYKYVE